MEQPDSLFYELQEILNKRNFEALAPFRESVKWQKLQLSERELLAQLFIQQGTLALQNEEAAAQEHFELARKVAGENAFLFYSLGKAYLSVEPTIKALNSALEMFNHSIKLSSTMFDSWYATAEAWMFKGTLLEDPECYIEAKWFCEKAATFVDSLSTVDQGRLFWLWGKILYLIGKNSEEAVDFKAALTKYEMAGATGLAEAEFWNDWGNLYAELAALIERHEFYAEAIKCYRLALLEAHDSFDSWLALGLCYYSLCSMGEAITEFNAREYFTSATRCFENCAKLDVTSHLLWLKWGQLLYEWGKLEGDVALLESSLLKFQKADMLHPNDFTTLFCQGGAKMLLGSFLERIDLLKEAERKLLAALEIRADSEEVWCLLGNCMYEMGRYFSDEAYYYLAIEKFQCGLAINKTSFVLWHGLALSFSSVGEMRNDIALLQKASNFYAKSVEVGGAQVLQCWNDWGINLMKSAELTSDQANIEAAIEKFECAIELEKSWDPDGEPDMELLYNYGCAYDSLGEFSNEASCHEKAIQALTKVLQLDASHLHARYNLAMALAHLGELVVDVECFVRAIDQFEQLTILDPEDEMAWTEYGATLLTLAMLVHDPIVPQKSESYFQEAEVKLMHATALGYAPAYYPLACLYALRNHYGMAMFYMQKAKSTKGLPPLEDMMHDEWLDALRETEEFQQFILTLDEEK